MLPNESTKHIVSKFLSNEILNVLISDKENTNDFNSNSHWDEKRGLMNTYASVVLESHEYLD